MEHIGCPDYIIAMISGNLWPAYEDLFDEAEEHVLIMLLSQWNDLCWRDSSRFHKVTYIYIPPYMSVCVYVLRVCVLCVYVYVYVYVCCVCMCVVCVCVCVCALCVYVCVCVCMDAVCGGAWICSGLSLVGRIRHASRSEAIRTCSCAMCDCVGGTGGGGEGIGVRV